jgi:hypothetical protein
MATRNGQAILDESRRGNRPRHACGAPARELLSIHRVLELLALGRWADVGGIRAATGSSDY